MIIYDKFSFSLDAAIRLVEALYEGHPAGGLMHIVTDDGNLEDCSVKWCMSQECLSIFDEAPSEIEIRVWIAFMDMTERERELVYTEFWRRMRCDRKNCLMMERGNE